jgi:carbon monoxide dehydrogenase subunit G
LEGEVKGKEYEASLEYYENWAEIFKELLRKCAEKIINRTLDSWKKIINKNLRSR